MLEGYPQRKLNQAWKIVLARYPPKARTSAAAGIRRIELRVIEAVEKLCPELGTESLIRTKLRILEDGEVKVFYSVSAYVRLGTRIVAVAVIGTFDEHRSVKPMSQPLVQRTGSQRRWASSHRPGAARVGNA